MYLMALALSLITVLSMLGVHRYWFYSLTKQVLSE